MKLATGLLSIFSTLLHRRFTPDVSCQQNFDVLGAESTLPVAGRVGVCGAAGGGPRGAVSPLDAALAAPGSSGQGHSCSWGGGERNRKDIIWVYYFLLARDVGAVMAQTGEVMK